MTTQATLRSRRTKAESVYHVQITGDWVAPTSPLVKIQGRQDSRSGGMRPPGANVSPHVTARGKAGEMFFHKGRRYTQAKIWGLGHRRKCSQVALMCQLSCSRTNRGGAILRPKYDFHH